MASFLKLNPQHHVLDHTIGFAVMGLIAGAAIISVAAVFLSAAQHGVFSGPW